MNNFGNWGYVPQGSEEPSPFYILLLFDHEGRGFSVLCVPVMMVLPQCRLKAAEPADCDPKGHDCEGEQNFPHTLSQVSVEVTDS